jgi:hypothetical protein
MVKKTAPAWYDRRKTQIVGITGVVIAITTLVAAGTGLSDKVVEWFHKVVPDTTSQYAKAAQEATAMLDSPLLPRAATPTCNSFLDRLQELRTLIPAPDDIRSLEEKLKNSQTPSERDATARSLQQILVVRQDAEDWHKQAILSRCFGPT